MRKECASLSGFAPVRAFLSPQKKGSRSSLVFQPTCCWKFGGNLSNQGPTQSLCQAELNEGRKGQLVSRLPNSTVSVFGYSFVFHDKAKRTQQGNLLAHVVVNFFRHKH